MVMNGIHKIPRPEWATRYAAQMWRREVTGSIKELVAAGARSGCRLATNFRRPWPWVNASRSQARSFPRRARANLRRKRALRSRSLRETMHESSSSVFRWST